MSIVKMRRIRLIGLLSEQDELVHQMLLRNCVEVSEVGDGEENALILAKAVDSRLNELRSEQVAIGSAIKILDQYAPAKTGLFPIRKNITTDELFRSENSNEARNAADKIIQIDREITGLFSSVSHAKSEMESLALWERLDIPMGFSGTKETTVMLGSFSSGIDKEEIEGALSEKAPLSYIEWAGNSREQQCAMLICHNSVINQAVETIRDLGFSQISVDTQDTASYRLKELHQQIENINTKITDLKVEIGAYADMRDDLKLFYDYLEQDISKEEAKERLVVSGRIFAMEGWVTAPQEEILKKDLDSYTCAFEFSEPEDEEDVPVKLKSNRLTRPMNMVTEMYSLPVYKGIDPNGLIWPFVVLFFGIMYADLGYGLVLIAISIFSRRFKPRGMVGYMMGLMLQCGISTAIFGFLLGGFFGDLIPVFADTFLGKEIKLWALIDPLSDPTKIMYIALALGAFQIIVGMAVKVYLCFRDGHPLDAFLDVGTWWLFFIGVGLIALGFGDMAIAVTVAAVVLLILTQGRSSPTIIGKIIGGIASLYDITSYLSDILSYIRLMSLLLATSVIASVVNILASMPGNIILFVIIVLIGHAFNMGINIVGTYVHTIRLQYLEFFGKFYEEGGRPFNPLKIKTKYHDVIDN